MWSPLLFCTMTSSLSAEINITSYTILSSLARKLAFLRLERLHLRKSCIFTIVGHSLTLYTRKISGKVKVFQTNLLSWPVCSFLCFDACICGPLPCGQPCWCRFSLWAQNCCATFGSFSFRVCISVWWQNSGGNLTAPSSPITNTQESLPPLNTPFTCYSHVC